MSTHEPVWIGFLKKSCAFHNIRKIGSCSGNCDDIDIHAIFAVRKQRKRRGVPACFIELTLPHIFSNWRE
ncbi:MAG: hypothetical protein KAR40_07735 [Candidatus Sabulitectum sp.]|nr:hypothetical protein [Candidatus Sabulitectum sp.]